MSIPHVTETWTALVRARGSCEAGVVISLSRRVLWFALWAASACVGGPISDLPHSGDNESPHPSDSALDAGLPAAANDAGERGDGGDGGADAGDASLPLSLPDGGVGGGAELNGADPCKDIER